MSGQGSTPRVQHISDGQADSEPGSSSPLNWLAGCLMVTVVLASYANSFRGEFVFDDLPAIVENDTIRSGFDLGKLLQPPAPSTVAGRPVLNLTFALNHAIAKDAAWSYNAFNL